MHLPGLLLWAASVGGLFHQLMRSISVGGLSAVIATVLVAGFGAGVAPEIKAQQVLSRRRS
jgi:ABC-type uncharacterized transport system permease subunit